MNKIIDILYESISSVLIPESFVNEKITIATQWLTWCLIVIAIIFLITLFLLIAWWLIKQVYNDNKPRTENKTISIYHHRSKR